MLVLVTAQERTPMSDHDELPLLMSFKRAGYVLACSTDTIKREIRRGRLEKRKVGRLSRVTTESVLALVNSKRPLTETVE
jgi:hypothetical protein